MKSGSLRAVVGSALLALSLCGAAGWHSARAAAASPAQKVFRYAFPVAETGFDPVQISDLYSATILSNIIESPLTYDYLARPVKLKLQTAAEMPQVSADFKTYTVKIRPGIYFADDPAFKGHKRELVAADYVFSLKRIFDPRWKSPSYPSLADEQVLGLEALRTKAIKDRTPFDYDTEIEGLRTLDRYTYRITLGKPSPRFVNNFASSGALAREVVEAYGDKIMEHPVGTGPYVLSEWQRSSRMVLTRNPNFREQFYEAEPPADDPAAQALYARMKGKRLPMIDRVEVSIVEESQPRWLAFLNAEHDMLERLPAEFTTLAIPNNRIAPNLAARGIQMVRTPGSDIAFTYFNMRDPLVGGYTPEKVALRRAIALAYDTQTEIRLVRRNQAVPAESTLPPMTFGYDPKWKSEMSLYDPARAKALLDLYGYVDRDGDGWRDRPDGQPLTLIYSTSPDQTSRQLNELWKKYMDEVNLKVEFKIGKWPEQLKAARAGKVMMWGLGQSAGSPDADGFLALAYGPQKGEGNLAFFDLPAFNKLYDAQTGLGDTPERLALMQEASKLLVAYMPMKVHAHRIATDLTFPWVIGYQRHPFMREFWRYLDIDAARAAARK
ncbi:MAG: ABC transporter substrate-binding protein [Burkholderiaceae bacterium]|nr:ABC transporter substrate-binding protein [Burkholderiaceae bacterium]